MIDLITPERWGDPNGKQKIRALFKSGQGSRDTRRQSLHDAC
jgi:hypothetical protein